MDANAHRQKCYAGMSFDAKDAFLRHRRKSYAAKKRILQSEKNSIAISGEIGAPKHSKQNYVCNIGLNRVEIGIFFLEYATSSQTNRRKIPSSNPMDVSHSVPTPPSDSHASIASDSAVVESISD